VPDPAKSSEDNLVDDYFELLSVGLAPLAKTTAQGMIISGGLTLAKGFIKYHINRDDPEAQRNITIQTGRELTSGVITNGVGGGVINKMTKRSPNAASAVTVPNALGISTKPLADTANDTVNDVSTRMGLTTTEQSSRELYNDTPDKKMEDKWKRAMDDIEKGFKTPGNHSLSAETITFLREQGIDIDKIIKWHAQGDSFTNATTDGVTDYSQVQYDYQGVNEIYGEAREKFKKLEQLKRLERIDNNLKKLQEKLSGSQTVTIPFTVLQDFRDAGVRIDEFLQGNAPYQGDAPKKKYEIPSENSLLDYTQVKRLRFIAKAQTLDENDIEGGVRLLRELRESMKEGELVYIPEKLIFMLKIPGSRALSYIMSHGHVRPAIRAAERKGFASPNTNLNVGDYKLSKRGVDKLIAMFWGQSVTDQRTAYNDLIKHINDIEAAKKTEEVSPADADVQRYGLPTTFTDAVKRDGRFDLQTYLVRNAKYSRSDGRMLLSQNQLNHLAGELYATLPAEDRNDIDLQSTAERFESNHQATAENWKSVEEDLQGIILGSRRPLTTKTIKFLRANGIDIDNLLVGNGIDELPDTELISLDQKGGLAIRKAIDSPLRQSKIREKLQQLDALEATLEDGGSVMLPESLRVFLRDSSLIDDSDPYINNIKTAPVTAEELDWMRWALKAEAELSGSGTRAPASPSETAAFMSELEASAGEGYHKMLPPHLIERLKAHGYDIDNYLMKNGDKDIATEMAKQRGNENDLRSQDIIVTKDQIKEIREQFIALHETPASETPVNETPASETPADVAAPVAENNADPLVTT
jgi:hypothetical protein